MNFGGLFMFFCQREAAAKRRGSVSILELWNIWLTITKHFLGPHLEDTSNSNMLLTLTDDHKKHLSLLTAQTPQVLQDFCKLALDFLRKGANMKLYHTAANKLGVQPEAIRNVVEGLVNLLVESSKHELTAADFKDTLVTLGFTEEHQDVLCTFYEGMKSEIRDVLSDMTISVPHYKNLEWRFEAQCLDPIPPGLQNSCQLRQSVLHLM